MNDLDNVIQATIIPENKRLEFLPSKLTHLRAVVEFENLLYGTMRAITQRQYNGGYWKFVDLDNGGMVCLLDSDDEFDVLVSSNAFGGTMSAKAASIVANIFALNTLVWQLKSDRILELYHWLLDYASQQEESSKIFSAID